MEKQSLTQEKSNDKKLFEKKEEILKSIKENINWIYILLMIFANCIVSLVRIEDASIALNCPHSALGWLLWALQIIMQTAIGVMILNSFRRQGIKSGHNEITDIYTKYLSCLVSKKNTKQPRNLKEYMKTEAKKDAIFKASSMIILSIFMTTVILDSNLNALVSLITNIIFAIGFGIKALLDAEEFVITELVIWYQRKIEELTDQKLEPSKKERKNVKGNKTRNMCRTRSRKSSGIQQEEKCTTGSETINTV